jgi:hypothetical protein
MKKHWQTVVVATALVVGWSAPAVAKQGNGRGHGKDKSHQERRSTIRQPPVANPVVVIDREGHRRIVTEYFSRESLPPGLAKRQSLPPGLAKQLRERGHLPPGLQKRLVPVPAPLASRLPAIPPPYRRYFAGRDLIVVDPRTNMVVAVIPDVAR